MRRMHADGRATMPPVEASAAIGRALPRIEAKEYMDEYVNPDSFMEQQRQKKSVRRMSRA